MKIWYIEFFKTFKCLLSCLRNIFTCHILSNHLCNTFPSPSNTVWYPIKPIFTVFGNVIDFGKLRPPTSSTVALYRFPHPNVNFFNASRSWKVCDGTTGHEPNTWRNKRKYIIRWFNDRLVSGTIIFNWRNHLCKKLFMPQGKFSTTLSSALCFGATRTEYWCRSKW